MNETKTLDFWCRDCELKFAAVSNHSEFEQAICPSCDLVCMTFDFELTEAQRTESQEDAANDVLTGSVGCLFGLLAIVGIAAASGASKPKRRAAIFGHVDDAKGQSSVSVVTELAAAHRIVRLLGSNGIICEISEHTTDEKTEFRIQVASRDKTKAKRLLADSEN